MKWTVSRRIALGFGLVLGLALIIAVVGIYALRHATDAYDRALAQERTTVQTALAADVASNEASEQFLRFILSGDEPFAERMDAAAARSRTLLTELRQEAPTAPSRNASA